MKKPIFVWLLLGSFVFAQDRRQIRELDPVVATDITDDTAVFFGVDKTDVPKSYRISLAELKKINALVINVKQYGAVGDGVTDDTAAFVAAFDAATSKAVYIPQGNYNLSLWGVYNLDSRDLHVVCDEGAIITGNSGVDFIECGTDSNFSWEGGRITSFNYALVCAANTTGGNKFYCMRTEIDNCVRAIVDAGTNTGTYGSFEVRYCYIHDCDEMGIVNRHVSQSHCIVSDNRIVDIGGTAANAFGILIGNNAVNSTLHCLISGNSVDTVSSTAGTEVHGIICYANYAKIVSNTINDVASPSTGGEGLYAKVTWGVIAGNTLINAGENGEGFITIKGQPRVGGDGSGEGWQNIVADNSIISTRSNATDNTGIYVQIQDALITDNTIEATASGKIRRGIAVAGRGAVVNGNVVRGIKSDTQSVTGISVTDYGDVRIIDNTIEDVSTSLVGGAATSLLVSAPSLAIENISVLRNKISTMSGGTDNFGILVLHANTITNLTIEDNHLIDCSKGIDFGVTTTATVTGVSIRRNQFYDFQRNGMLVVGIWIEGCHQCVVSDNLFDTFNSADNNLDVRAIYLQNASVNKNRDVSIMRNRISNLTHSTNAARERTMYFNTTAAFDGLVIADNELNDVGYVMYSTNISNVTSLQLLRNRAYTFDTTYTLGTFSTDAVIDGNTANGALVYQTKWVKTMSGAGSPESSVTAPVGTLYLRSDGGASTTLYVKESGTGNTGWVAK